MRVQELIIAMLVTLLLGVASTGLCAERAGKALKIGFIMVMVLTCGIAKEEANKPLKVAFVMVGPASDYGYNRLYAVCLGRIRIRDRGSDL